jgi:hypothetical protein
MEVPMLTTFGLFTLAVTIVYLIDRHGKWS